MLRPASGFQSWQFKLLEAKLGLKFEYRHGKEYYTSQLRKEHVDLIKKAESDQSFLQLVNAWLERMPFFDDLSLWKDFEGASNSGSDEHPFWQAYKNAYANSLAEAEKNNLDAFDEVMYHHKETHYTL